MGKARGVRQRVEITTPEQLAELYHTAFSTQAGEAVYEDLEKRFQNTSSFHENPYRSAFNEGARSVFLLIRSLMKKHETQ